MICANPVKAPPVVITMRELFEEAEPETPVRATSVEAPATNEAVPMK